MAYRIQQGPQKPGSGALELPPKLLLRPALRFRYGWQSQKESPVGEIGTQSLARRERSGFDRAAPSCHKVDANRCGLSKAKLFRLAAEAANRDSDTLRMRAIEEN